MGPSQALGATITFRQGVSSYNSTQDTELREVSPSTSFGSASTISIDTDDSGGELQGLVSFDNIFGAGASQIPFGSTINSASLTMYVIDESTTPVATVTLHRMLSSWNESSTWNSLGGGVQTNDTEALNSPDATLPNAALCCSQTFTGLAAAVQSWSDGNANEGWVILSTSDDGWDFESSESSDTARRPLLTVDYSPPPQLEIVKRAYRLDGTSIAHSSDVAVGARFKFLLYVNNTGGARSDLSMEDVLDPAFIYQTGTMSFASLADCASATCTGLEEDAIFAAADTGTSLTDAVNADVASLSGSTVHVGNETVANGQLDIAANSVWAIVFTVKMD